MILFEKKEKELSIKDEGNNKLGSVTVDKDGEFDIVINTTLNVHELRDLISELGKFSECLSNIEISTALSNEEIERIKRDTDLCDTFSCYEDCPKCVAKYLKSVRYQSICQSETVYPISKDKMDNCYTPNGETHPLCKGKLGNTDCPECNLYENMPGPYDNV